MYIAEILKINFYDLIRLLLINIIINHKRKVLWLCGSGFYLETMVFHQSLGHMFSQRFKSSKLALGPSDISQSFGPDRLSARSSCVIPLVIQVSTPMSPPPKCLSCLPI
jgi:hypothetical protein